MPVDFSKKEKEALYQRSQYAKGGLGKLYWDYRDRIIFNNVKPDAKNILDLGCGEGITLEKLIKTFPDKNIKGVDIIEENIKICKIHNLPASLGNIARLDIPEGSVDCCILSEVIEHIENFKDIFLEIKRILKKEGRLIVVIPNDLNFKIARLAAFMFKEARYDAGHVCKWNPKELKDQLNNLGFAVKKVTNIPFLWWRLSLHSVISADKL